MLEYLDRLVQSNLTLFYIYTLGETGAYVETAGRVYREALRAVGSNGECAVKRWLDQLRSVSHSGLCNGFYFGVSGQGNISALKRYLRSRDEGRGEERTMAKLMAPGERGGWPSRSWRRGPIRSMSASGDGVDEGPTPS
ncbi:MAG: U32 family peptidase [Candidatus Methylomirabilis sp.]|nr:U32 family peptidase [Candidatus Methylomirabilis sp.]